MFCVQSVWLENCNLERSSLNALGGSALGGDGSYLKSSPKPSEAVRPVDHANVVQQRWLMYQVSLYLYFRTCTGNCIDAVFFTTARDIRPSHRRRLWVSFFQLSYGQLG